VIFKLFRLSRAVPLAKSARKRTNKEKFHDKFMQTKRELSFSSNRQGKVLQTNQTRAFILKQSSSRDIHAKFYKQTKRELSFSSNLRQGRPHTLNALNRAPVSLIPRLCLATPLIS
jgi:hypothetical protein